jgi:hypothetical protein
MKNWIQFLGVLGLIVLQTLACADPSQNSGSAEQLSPTLDYWKPYTWTDSNGKMTVLEEHCGTLPSRVAQELQSIKATGYDPDTVPNIRCIPCYKGMFFHQGLPFRIQLGDAVARNQSSCLELRFTSSTAYILDSLLEKCAVPQLELQRRTSE